MGAKEALRKRKVPCDICGIKCSSVLQLCDHVMGQKHKTNVKRVSPESLPHVNKLQHCFDTHIKEHPLVGLEYVEELQSMNGDNYQYRCLLCGFHGDRHPALVHITGTDHITKYLDKHHPDLAVFITIYHQKPEYAKALQDVAGTVCQTYGRKTIKEIVVDDGPTLEKVAQSPPSTQTGTDAGPSVNGEIHTTSLQYLEQEGNQCQEELSQFKGNSDFFEYLQKFKIQSDEDAWVIKQITQNCTRALMRFRQEQTQQGKPWGEVPGPYVVNPGMDAPVHAALPQDEATQLFFSSIKNMEESEVVAILHKIAAANPAFRGIDIPSVIKYLQSMGRLKSS